MKSLRYFLICVIAGIFCERYYELALILFLTVFIVPQYTNISINIRQSILFLFMCLLSFMTVMIMGYELDKFVLMAFTIAIFSFCYYNLFKVIRKNCINELFQIYLKFTILLSLIGIFQFVVFLLSGWDFLRPLYGYPNSPQVLPGVLRIYSIMDEPAYFAAIITPAFIYHLLSDSYECRKYPIYERIIIYLALILTFSSASYVVIALCFIYKYLILNAKHNNTRSYTKAIPLLSLVGLMVLFYISVDNRNNNDKGFDTFKKIEETYNALSDINPSNFESLNLSSYATLTNMWVAMNAPNRITGTGLGTHVQNYEKMYKSNFQYYGLNSEDGYSLLNRIYSEFGLLGILLLVLFLYKNFNKKSIINVSVFFLLLTLCLRGGNYVRYGCVFFIYLYYYTNKQYKYD